MKALSTTSIVLAACLALAACVVPASAVALYWTGTSGIDNSWGTPTNWNPNGTPGASSDVTFTAASTNLSTTLGATNYQIYTIFQSGVTGDVSIGSTGGALTFNGWGIAWYGGAAHDLSISAPVVVSGPTEAWWAEPGTKVSISNSMTLNTVLLFRGNSGNTGAGTFSFSGNETVAGGKYFQVGDSGFRGNVEITGGTFDESAGTDVIIGQTGGTGTLTVSGGKYIQSTSGALYVGNSSGSNGTLTVTGSGVVQQSGSGLLVGRSSGNGTVTISGNGLFDESAGSDVIIGQTGGTGILAVSGGKYIQSTNNILYLGNDSGNGTLTLSGSGVVEAATASSSIVVGRWNGTGTLNLDGGSLYTSRSIRGSDAGSGTGTVYFNGGTLKAKDGANANWLLSASTFSAIVKGSSAANSGAVIDTNGYAMGIPVALTHYAAGPAIDGGLTLNDTAVTKGTLTLSGANTYTGLTSVLAGTLTLSGSAIGTVTGGLNVAGGATFNPGGTFTVGSGKTLSGAGSVLNSVIASGSTINPGDTPPGTLTVQGGLTLDSASVLNYQFNGAPGGSNDLIALTTAGTRALTVDGTLNISNLGGLTMGQYTLISGATSITDNGLDIGAVSGGYTASNFTVSHDASNVYLNVADIPEPATMILLGTGLLGLLRRARRRIGA